jgi:hypothetical protein
MDQLQPNSSLHAQLTQTSLLILDSSTPIQQANAPRSARANLNCPEQLQNAGKDIRQILITAN